MFKKWSLKNLMHFLFNAKSTQCVHWKRFAFLGFLEKCCKQNGVPKECMGICIGDHGKRVKNQTSKCKEFKDVLKKCVVQSEGNSTIMQIKLAFTTWVLPSNSFYFEKLNMNMILQATKIRQQQDWYPLWKKSCITQKVIIFS